MAFSYVGTRSSMGWREWGLRNTEVEEGELVLVRELSPETVLGDTNPVAIDVDHCGDLYVFDSSGAVQWYERSSGRRERLRLVGGDDGRVANPSAICVTTDRLYVADGADGSVHAFSKRTLQRQWVSDTPFEDPVAIDHDGRHVYVLFRGTEAGEGVIALLEDGGHLTSVVTGLASPADLAVDSAGNRYVLDTEYQGADTDPVSVVRMYTGVRTDHELAVSRDDDKTEVVEVDPDVTCIEAVNVREIIVATGHGHGDGTILTRYTFEDGPPETMVRFGRGCSTLVAAREGNGGGQDGFYAVDRKVPEVYFLQPRGKTRRNDRTAAYDGQAVKRFDSGERQTQWHRVKLDLSLGGRDTQVRLSYVATDDEEPASDSGDFQRQGGIAQSDAERLFDWKRIDEPNPSDALLKSAEGRYLWVKIELIGSEHSSPRVSSFRAYFPRLSYLRHLPQVYREDEASEEFLERFLAIFESVFVDIEERFRGVTRYLDPEGVPGESLPWLGSWMAIELDEDWPEGAKRELLSRSPDLFKKRGTREGLLALLGIYLRHARPRSVWQEALSIDDEAIIDAVNRQPQSVDEASAALGEHDRLRAVSGEPILRRMVAAWSTLLDQHRETLEELVDAGHLTEEAAAEEESEHVDLLRQSDHGSLRYLVEYARELERITKQMPNGGSSAGDVNAIRERYRALIRESSRRDVPYLIEAPDLDCIERREVREPYAELLGHERGFLVLVRSPIDGDAMRVVRRIVESEQPAHTAGRAVELRPRIRLGRNSYLGINSVLSARELVLDRSRFGEDSAIDT